MSIVPPLKLSVKTTLSPAVYLPPVREAAFDQLATDVFQE